MPHNILITGPPRSGKTTVIERVCTGLADEGYQAGGLVCPERRSEGERVGFDIVDVLTGETCVLADVDREIGPSVGKYGVHVENVDRLSRTALPRARREADFVVIDEIAPMEVHSDVFVREVETSLASGQPLLAAVHQRSTDGFIGSVKARDDLERFRVDEQSRETLPNQLVKRLFEALSDQS